MFAACFILLWGSNVLYSTQFILRGNCDVLQTRSAVWKMSLPDKRAQNLNGLTSMINWLESPFVTTIQNDCNQPVGEVRLHDLLYDPSEYIHVPESIVRQPLLLKSFVDRRHELNVQFTLSESAISPVELRWVHFRGNLRIEPLGMSGKSLVIQPGESAKQYTHPGHLFVALRLESNNENTESNSMHLHEQHQGFADLDRLIHRIVGIYLIPSIHQTCPTDLDCSHEIMIGRDYGAFYHTEKLAADTVCGQNLSPGSDHADEVDCFRSLLAKYWEHQRLSQVYVNTWAVPTIPISNPPALTDVQGTALGLDSQVDVDVGGEVHVAHEHDLWKVFDLDSSLAESASTFHLIHRRVTGVSFPEPPISLVFNQFEVPSWYVPLPSHLLDRIIEEVRRAAAVWLNISPEDLFLTGAYGSREYGHGALVRWHVDPVQTQPITAIVHVAEDCYGTQLQALDERNASQCNDLWALQVPKSISAPHNYSDYTSTSIHSPAWHHVRLRVGEVMLLQSAKLPHARMEPYPGNWYANAFVHFAPVGWDSRDDVRILS